jgi:hypothetical protein
VGIQIHPIYLTTIILLWLVVYHIVYWLAAIARDSALVCWSVGPFGISVVSLREPPARRVLAQLALAGAALAAVAYTSLYLVSPPPIAGLSRSPSGRAIAIGVPVATFTLVRLAAVLRNRRYPLWGEARVLTGVQRSLATGARVFFTPAGRNFLQERFGATPHEFLRMVRY